MESKVLFFALNLSSHGTTTKEFLSSSLWPFIFSEKKKKELVNDFSSLELF